MPIAQNKYPPQNHSAFLALAEEVERVKKMEGGTAFIVDLIEAVVESQGLVVVDKAEYESLSPGKVEGWREIASEPNDGAFRWYGLHVQDTKGYGWFEAHYIQHDDDGQMKLPSGDNFDDWAFDDFEVWCNAPSPPISSRAEDSCDQKIHE